MELKVTFFHIIVLFIKKILFSALYMYKRFISPLIGRNCIYYPSCSSFFAMALRKYSISWALYLLVKRLLKCNALFKGGIDFP